MEGLAEGKQPVHGKNHAEDSCILSLSPGTFGEHHNLWLYSRAFHVLHRHKSVLGDPKQRRLLAS